MKTKKSNLDVFSAKMDLWSSYQHFLINDSPIRYYVQSVAMDEQNPFPKRL